VIVHYAGNPCDLKKIKNLSNKYKFKIIEDASHALGSFYFNMPIGSPKYSDAVVTSFGPLKSITSAEGGAIFTNNKKNFQFNEIFKQSGVQKNKNNFYSKNNGSWWNEQQVLGYNYKLSELHASLGNSQLKKLNLFVKKRNKLSKIYEKKLSNKIKFQKISNKNNISARHIFIIRVNKKIRLKLFNFLKRNNIGAMVNYIPTYKHPYYKKIVRVNLNNFRETESYYSEAISIPLYYSLSEQEHQKVIKVINKFFNN
jgi:dTDP-4-amino-4,6-dideoxygalactose transaminase